jgi:hypothetical protein
LKKVDIRPLSPLIEKTIQYRPKKNKYNPINSDETSRDLTDNGNDADSDAEVIIQKLRNQKSK